MDIKLLSGKVISLDINRENIQSHFTNNVNHTKEILYQINEIGFYNEFVSKCDKNIIDLGANIGLFSIHVSEYADKIISVEPTPSHFDILCELTKNFPNINCLNAAASNFNGDVDFFICSSNSTMNSLVDRGEKRIKVNGIILEDILKIYNLDKVDFLKIDIEGSEILFLEEQKNINSISKNVNKVFIEFHEFNGINYKQYREKYENIFQNLGFKTKQISLDALFCYK